LPGRPVISFYSIIVVNNNDIALYIDIANNDMGDIMRIERNCLDHVIISGVMNRRIIVNKDGEKNA
jgi:hypothetical protein